jgi:flagellar hook protein FlgE
LQTGDLIQLNAGLNGQAVAGIYAVGAITNDTFEIYLVSSDAGAAAGAGGIANGLPASNAAAPAATALAVPAGTTWQKIAGQSFAPVFNAPITANIGVGTADAVVGGNGANNAARIGFAIANHGLAVGDVLFVSGGGIFNVGGVVDVNLPDGYYIVKAATANVDFQIEPLRVAANGTIAGAAANVKAGINYQKVGMTNGAGGLLFPAGVNGINTFDTTSLFTTIGLPAGTTSIILNVSNHKYNVGDTIRFTGLPAGGYTLDGITLQNGTNYKITATTPNSVTLTNMAGDPAIGAVIGAGGPPLIGNGYGTYSAAAPVLPRVNVGAGFRIDGASRLFKYFGINDVLPAGVNGATALPSTYDPGSTEKSLFGNKNLTSDNYFTYPLSLFDSLGETYNLNLRWAKLDKNRWAVEIAAVADPVTGLYDIIGVRADGQLASGEITFDQNGNFLTAGGLDAPIPSFSRKNGSASVQLQIDWKNALSEVKGLMVTQQGIANNVELVQANGQAAGNLVNLEVSQDGFIIGTFDSGETLKLYQIPVALFANVNGLRASIGGTFEITRDSGELLLKGAMVGGAGKVLGGVLEESNVDTTEELLEIQDLSNDIRANARAANVTNKNIQTILSESQ